MDEGTDLFRDEIDELLEIDLGSEEKVTSISVQASKSIDMYDEPSQYEAKKRHYYIKYIKKHIEGGWTQKNIDPLLAKVPPFDDQPKPKWRAVAHWYSRYKKSNFCMTALVPHHIKKGNRHIKNIDSNFYFNKALEDKYLCRERPSVATAYKYYCDLITQKNSRLVSGKISPLTYNGFNNRVKRLDPYDVDLARFGSSYVQRNYKLGSQFAKPTRVMERVEIDHTVLDITVLMEDHRTVIGRPTITALIDCYSSCIVGFYVSFNEPSYLSVRAALINTMLSKDYVKEILPSVKVDWPCYGKIGLLVVDNGAEFWSYALESACKDLGINTSYNPVGKPWKKPKIERFFRTLNTELLDSLPGKNFRSIESKGDYKSDKEAVLSFSEFNEILHKWIIEIYNQKADDRKTRVPIAKWHEGLSTYPPTQYTGDKLEYLCANLGLYETRTINQNGIQYLYLYYDSPELLDYRKYTPIASKRGLSVDIKINPHDLSYIFVYLEEQECYIKVPTTERDGYTIGLTLTQHKVNIKNRNKKVTDDEDSLSLAQSRLELHQMVNQALTKKKNQKAMKKLAKYQDIDSHNPISIDITKSISKEPQSPDQHSIEKKSVTMNHLDWDSDDIEAF